jgi:uncharacterized protein YhbP (UPF0306 family)
MNLPDIKILKFLKEHHVLTLATCVDNKPWCANCFYVLLEDEMGLVFTSDIETRHIREALVNCNVSGSIVLETAIAGKMQGMQFEGKLRKLDIQLSDKGTRAYLKRFPMTMLMNTTLWFLELSHIKMTDNRLGLENKLIWRNSTK